jgi:phage/conjugal plasmid C-4 type zinc finger TraR family protein
MDDVDRAQAAQALYLDAALERQQAQARRVVTHSGEKCLSCGDAIPEARQKAQPGAAFCTDCQEEFEKGR